MTTEVHQFSTKPLTSHAFNADRSRVAISCNDENVQIHHRQSGKTWVQEELLVGHDKVVTSIDWAPKTNRIVTCSQDRNAYVWTWTGAAWKPTLVLLRINRAATYASWSPKEDKFAVASGARCISVCSFDDQMNWWVAKQLKKPIRSTILALDWHPNNVLLAAGGADAKARVFSAYIKGIDQRPEPTLWGEKLPFNTLCGEYEAANGGWVHAVAFSPSGGVLAFASHDSTVSLVYPGGEGQPPAALYHVGVTYLPLLTLIWTSEETIVAAGHDCRPILFNGSQAGWQVTGPMDESSSDATHGVASPAKTSGPIPSVVAQSSVGVGRLNSDAFNRFRQADTRGISSTASSSSADGGSGSGVGGSTALQASRTGDSELPTVHQNPITRLRAYQADGSGNVSLFSTSGMDGRLVVWKAGGQVAGVTGRLGRMAV